MENYKEEVISWFSNVAQAPPLPSTSSLEGKAFRSVYTPSSQNMRLPPGIKTLYSDISQIAADYIYANKDCFICRRHPSNAYCKDCEVVRTQVLYQFNVHTTKTMTNSRYPAWYMPSCCNCNIEKGLIGDRGQVKGFRCERCTNFVCSQCSHVLVDDLCYQCRVGVP